MSNKTKDDQRNKIIELEDSQKDFIKQIRVLTGKVDELNNKLIISEKLKSHFLSNIRNEFVNPLATIIGLTDSLCGNEKISKKEMLDLVKLINSDAYHLEFQLENIFLSAELESGDAKPDFTTVKIETLARNLTESINKIYREVDTEIKIVNKTPDQEEFVTDAGFLKLILSNLLKNAFEFSEDEIDVSLYFEIKNDNLIITVIDHGIGIEKENFKVIFDRFKQLDEGHTKKHLGHGLGLSTVKECLNLLEGKIDIESELNEGSSFIVTLPKGQMNQELNGFDFSSEEFDDEEFDSF